MDRRERVRKKKKKKKTRSRHHFLLFRCPLRHSFTSFRGKEKRKRKKTKERERESRNSSSSGRALFDAAVFYISRSTRLVRCTQNAYLLRWSRGARIVSCRDFFFSSSLLLSFFSSFTSRPRPPNPNPNHRYFQMDRGRVPLGQVENRVLGVQDSILIIL